MRIPLLSHFIQWPEKYYGREENWKGKRQDWLKAKVMHKIDSWWSKQWGRCFVVFSGLVQSILCPFFCLFRFFCCREMLHLLSFRLQKFVFEWKHVYVFDRKSKGRGRTVPEILYYKLILGFVASSAPFIKMLSIFPCDAYATIRSTL